METFYTEQHFNNFYQTLVLIYKKNHMKLLLDKIREKFRYQYDKSNTEINKIIIHGYYHNLFKLKVILENQFMRDVNCTYKYILVSTPNSVGCDIRELINNNYLTDTLKESFLDNIKRASLYFQKYLLNNKKIPHILTDIDDTLYPSRSAFSQTSGRDSSWKNHEPYPGIKKFYELFYKSLDYSESRYTTILSATPMFLKETKIDDPTISEIIGPSYGFIQGSEKKRDAIQSLITGMVDRPFYYLAPSSEKIGTEKFFKFQQYTRIFPEYRLIFIGDNGQGDLIAGKKMIMYQNDCLVFIHNIIYNNSFLFTKEEEELHQKDCKNRLFFFKNYLELTYIFTNHLKMFSKEQYSEFRDATIKDLQQGLENLNEPTKSLYEHYICPNNSLSPNSCVKLNDLKLKRRTLKKRR